MQLFANPGFTDILRYNRQRRGIQLFKDALSARSSSKCPRCRNTDGYHREPTGCSPTCEIETLAVRAACEHDENGGHLPIILKGDGYRARWDWEARSLVFQGNNAL